MCKFANENTAGVIKLTNDESCTPEQVVLTQILNFKL
jgi:hypothetical protein